MSPNDGHPGVWGPGMESDGVRKAYQDWLDAHPAPTPRPICRAKDMVNTRSAA